MYHPTQSFDGLPPRIKRCDADLASPTFFKPVVGPSIHPAMPSATAQPLAILSLDAEQCQLVPGSIAQNFNHHALKRYRDRLWQEMIQVLCVRLRDEELASQTSATQFVIALQSDPLQQKNGLKARLADFFREPVRVGDQTSDKVSCHIGISLYSDLDLDAEALIRDTEAMIGAVNQDQPACEIRLFLTESSPALHRRLLIEQALQHPDLPQQLEMQYQPQWDHLSDRLYGFEGLMRWHHPVLGSISPEEFIPIAESLGCIHHITHHAILESLQFTREVLEKYDVILNPSVNISAQDFKNFRRLYDRIDHALRESQLPGNLLTVELTERVFLQPSEQINLQMQQLRDRGIRIALDDFGTGFSCLKYLLDLPLNMLKIDRAFVHHIHQDSRRHGVVKAIVAMAKSLDMRCVAEGVESDAELDCLREFGCHLTQGHMISPALSRSSFIQLLSQTFPPHDRDRSSNAV